MKKLALFTAALSLALTFTACSTEEQEIVSVKEATVTNVLQADLLELDGKQRFYLIGSSAFTQVGSRAGATVYGDSQRFAEQTLLNKKVYVETIAQESMKSNGYLFTEKPKKREDIEKVLFNAMLVREGHASVDDNPADNRYQDLLLTLEADAQKDMRGFWRYGITNTVRP